MTFSSRGRRVEVELESSTDAAWARTVERGGAHPAGSWCIFLNVRRPGAHRCAPCPRRRGRPTGRSRRTARAPGRGVGVGHLLAVGAHGRGDLVEADRREVGVDGSRRRQRLVEQELPGDRLERLGGDLLGHLHHAPLPVGEHEIDDRQVVAHGSLDLLRVHAERPVADDAADRSVGGGHLRAERLATPAPSMPNLNVDRIDRGDPGLVEEVGPHRGVAAVEDPDRVVGQHLLGDGRDPGGMERFAVVGQRLVELGAILGALLADTRQPVGCGGLVRGRPVAALELGDQRGPPASAGRRQDGEVDRLVRVRGPRVVDVDLDVGLLAGPAQFGALPHQSVSPSRDPTVRTTSASLRTWSTRSTCRHRDGVRRRSRRAPRGRPAGRDRALRAARRGARAPPRHRRGRRRTRRGSAAFRAGEQVGGRATSGSGQAGVPAVRCGGRMRLSSFGSSARR
jgi:hypothetical protein